jgi:hypothetical protein
MESYESLVALAMQAENLLVSGPVKFKIKMKTARKIYDEYQEHGYEVDLIGMRHDKLVLATVKSFLGSGGVKLKEVTNAEGANGKGYKMLNNVDLRTKMINSACEIYGYKPNQVEVRFYAGQFMGGKEQEVREWCAKQIAGGGPIEVFNLLDVIDTVTSLAKSKTYIDDPALVAVKSMIIAEEFRKKSAKAETKSREFTQTEIAEKFPIGSKVMASKDSIVGHVIGYSNQQTSKPYLKIRNEDSGLVWIRSASTCRFVS